MKKHIRFLCLIVVFTMLLSSMVFAQEDIKVLNGDVQDININEISDNSEENNEINTSENLKSDKLIEEKEEVNEIEELGEEAEEVEEKVIEEKVIEEKITEEKADRSTVKLNKTEVVPGESIILTIHLANWEPSQQQAGGPPLSVCSVDMYKDDELIGRRKAIFAHQVNLNGDGELEISIPEDFETGEYKIQALMFGAKDLDEQTIELSFIVKEQEEPEQPEESETTIKISPSQVEPNGKIELNIKSDKYINHINQKDIGLYLLDKNQNFIKNGSLEQLYGLIDFDEKGNGYLWHYDTTKLDLIQHSAGYKIKPGEYFLALAEKNGLKILDKASFTVIDYTKDVVKPVITVKGLEENGIVETSEITFTVSAVDDIDGEIIPEVTSLYDETSIKLINKKNGVYTYKATLKEGNNVINIKAKDEAGNEESKQCWVEYQNPDKKKVEIFVNGIEDNQEVNEEEITFIVSAESEFHGEIVPIVKVNENKIKELNGQYKTSLKKGKNNITIYATDNAGHDASKEFTVIYKPVEKVDPKDLPQIKIESLEDYEIVSNGDTATIKVVAKDKDGQEIEPKVFVKNGMMLKGGAPVPTGNVNALEEIKKQENGLYNIIFHKDSKNIAESNEIKEVIVEATDKQGRKATISKKVLYNGSGTVVFTETREIIKKDNAEKNEDQEITIYLGTEFESIKGSEYTLGIEKKGGGYYRTPSGQQITATGQVSKDGKVVDKLIIPKDIEPGEYWINFYFEKNKSNATINFKVNQETDTIAPKIKNVFRDLGYLESGATCEVHSNFVILKSTAHDLTDGSVDATVMLNGKKVERIEPKAYCRYKLDLNQGKNEVVVTAVDKSGNKGEERYTIISTKDTLNKIKLNKYRVNAGNDLKVIFDMKDYANEETELLLYNTDIDYYHKASRDMVDNDWDAFRPYTKKIQLNQNGQYDLDYHILENVRSGYYMLEGNFGGSVYRSPMFYVLGNEEDVIPPEISLRGIEDGFVYNNSEVEFSVITNDMRDGKVAPVVKLNGEVIECEKEGNYVANLVEGDNIIEVTAEDKNGNIDTKQVSVEYVKVDINDNSVVETRKAIGKTSYYLKNNSTYSSDWKIVGIANAGKAVQKAYLADIEEWAEKSKATSDKITDYERIALGIAAAGGDPRNIGGYNLIDKIYNYDEQGEIYFQGLNGVIYGLIAMDTNRYFVPDSALYTREDLVDYVLEKQNDDGGWDLYMNGESDVDITSMTLISLAPYHDREDVRQAVEKAANWLSIAQRKDNAGFNSWKSEDNSESVSQTIIGLCANGIDPTSDKFTKNGSNLIDALLSFAQEDGTYLHTKDGSGVTGMSTEQAYQALLAYDKFVKMGRKSKDGKASIYYFNEKLADAKGLVMGVDLDKDDNKISKINVQNLGDKEQDALLIIGLYDKENRMVDSIKVTDTIGVNESKNIYREYNVPNGEDYTVKVLLWDSLEGQNPLKSHPVMIKVN